MAKRYALMLLTQAELLAEFETAEEAEAALVRLIDADESLMHEAGIVAFDSSGKPIGEPVRRPSLASA